MQIGDGFHFFGTVKKAGKVLSFSGRITAGGVEM